MRPELSGRPRVVEVMMPDLDFQPRNRSLNVDAQLYALVFGESVLNDAVMFWGYRGTSLTRNFPPPRTMTGP